MSPERALVEWGELDDVACRSGVSTADAQRLCAALAELPALQVVRILGTAHQDRVRQINRNGRTR